MPSYVTAAQLFQHYSSPKVNLLEVRYEMQLSSLLKRACICIVNEGEIHFFSSSLWPLLSITVLLIQPSPSVLNLTLCMPIVIHGCSCCHSGKYGVGVWRMLFLLRTKKSKDQVIVKIFVKSCQILPESNDLEFSQAEAHIQREKPS